MADIPQEPAAMMAALLSQIITDIKGGRPTQTNGSGLALGFVFSQQPIGQMVDPRDYVNAWTPAGGTPPIASGGSNTVPVSAVQQEKMAHEAAYNTATLVDTMIMVTDDGGYQGWPLGRHLSIAYGELLQAMAAAPAPTRSPAQQQAIDLANKVLYVTDPAGYEAKTPKYSRYSANAAAHAKAKADFARAQAQAQNDPTAGDWWPQESVVLQQAVNDAWNTWKTQGADEVEGALATLESLGIPLEQGMIAKSRQIYDAWELGLAGVPDPVAYSSIEPSQWADPSVDDIGFTRLTIDKGAYQSHYDSHQLSVATGSWSSNSSSSSGEGAVGVFGFGFELAHGESKQSADGHTRSDTWGDSHFANDSKDLKIDLEYGLCRIMRPWLLTDVFYLQNYWVTGQKMHSVSDGTLSGQIKKALPPFLPMVPTHFLVIRNVTISFTGVSSDADTFSHLFGQSDSQSLFTANSTSGGAAGMIGPITFGGGASHQESHFSASTSDTHGADDRANYGITWENNTLSIKGAQIIAWLSEIVPAAAPLDDPNLPKPT